MRNYLCVQKISLPPDIGKQLSEISTFRSLLLPGWLLSVLTTECLPVFPLPQIARMLPEATRSWRHGKSASSPPSHPLFHKRRLPKGFSTPIHLALLRRAVVQLGRTLEWGSRGREFESSNRIFGKFQPVRGLQGAIFTYSLTIRESLPECCLYSPQYRLFLKCAVAVTLRKAAKFGAKNNADSRCGSVRA
jgi:hypothetical protein